MTAMIDHPHDTLHELTHLQPRTPNVNKFFKQLKYNKIYQKWRQTDRSHEKKTDNLTMILYLGHRPTLALHIGQVTGVGSQGRLRFNDLTQLSM